MQNPNVSKTHDTNCGISWGSDRVRFKHGLIVVVILIGAFMLEKNGFKHAGAEK